jgi:hypothetical protein
MTQSEGDKGSDLKQKSQGFGATCAATQGWMHQQAQGPVGDRGWTVERTEGREDGGQTAERMEGRGERGEVRG